MSRERERDEVKRQFQGLDALDELLSLAGSRVTAEGAVAGFRKAQADGQKPGDVIPALFDGEPRFSSPAIARALFGNLLGLWDLLARGGTPERGAPTRPSRPKKAPPPPAPEALGGEPPTSEWASGVLGYLAAVPKEHQRVLDSFENRADALLAWLDVESPNDAVFACARGVLFELYALIFIGDAGAVRSIRVEDLMDSEVADISRGFSNIIPELITRVTGVVAPDLSGSDASKVEALVQTGARAIFRTRRTL